jgi:hypothetical protein
MRQFDQPYDGGDASERAEAVRIAREERLRHRGDPIQEYTASLPPLGASCLLDDVPPGDTQPAAKFWRMTADERREFAEFLRETFHERRQREREDR